MRLRMLEQWNSFSRALSLENASPVQRTEMRRAFYAGGACILDALVRAVSPGDDPTEDDLRVMTDLQDEFEQFTASVKEGKA